MGIGRGGGHHSVIESGEFSQGVMSVERGAVALANPQCPTFYRHELILQGRAQRGSWQTGLLVAVRSESRTT